MSLYSTWPRALASATATIVVGVVMLQYLSPNEQQMMEKLDPSLRREVISQSRDAEQRQRTQDLLNMMKQNAEDPSRMVWDVDFSKTKPSPPSAPNDSTLLK